MCLLCLHADQQPDATKFNGYADKASCSHGCVPASVKARGGEMQAQAVFQEIFKTSLAVEEYYWCTRDKGIKSNAGLANQCLLARPDEIRQRDPSCQGDNCLYTGPTPLRYWNPKAGMCDDDTSKGKYWRFRSIWLDFGPSCSDGRLRARTPTCP
jgi:hypothetical protein